MKQKVMVKDLKPGMYVSELDRSWLETPFLFQGFRIRSGADIKEIASQCEFVFIDTDKSYMPIESDGDAPLSSSTPPRDLGPSYTTTVEEEINPARRIRERAMEYVGNMLDDVRAGKALNVKAGKALVSEMTESVLRNPDALLLLTILKDKSQYAMQHSINVCILSLIFSRYMGFGKSLLNEIGIGALLHDIGEARIPKDLVGKEQMTQEEQEVMRQHTQHGFDILDSTPGLPESAKEIAVAHHERLNGTGYPKGIRGREIQYLAKLVSIVDVYEEVTSRSINGLQLTSNDVLKNMYSWRNELFDAELVESFIQCLGIYPIGSVVELNTGEVGIVISVDPDAKLLPRVMLVRDPDKNPYMPPRVINLRQYTNEEARGVYEITRVVEHDAYGIDLKSYLIRDLYPAKVASAS